MVVPPLHPARRDAADALAGPGVPDVPDAVVGWRTWRVGRRAQRRAELIAPLAGVPWRPRQPTVASCGSSSHAPPGDRCACGLYAVTDPGTLEWGPSDLEVLGVVALWGQVVEGARGWRGSHGYPRFVVTGPAVATEQRAALSRRYGVPVHRSEVPPRDLASRLGAEAVLADTLRLAPDAEVEAVLAARMAGWVRQVAQARAEAATSRRPRTAVLGRGRR